MAAVMVLLTLELGLFCSEQTERSLIFCVPVMCPLCSRACSLCFFCPSACSATSSLLPCQLPWVPLKSHMWKGRNEALAALGTEHVKSRL